MTADVPLFPLHTVLFPGGRLPLRIFEPRYMDMAKACLKDGSPFGVCLIREGSEVLEMKGAPAVPAAIGTLARIATWDMPQLGVLEVVALGGSRFRIREHRVEASGLARGAVDTLPDDEDAAIPPSCAGCVALIEKVIEHQPALFEPPLRKDSASWVSSRLVEVLPLPLDLKQELLEMPDAVGRLERLNALLRS